MLINNKEFPQEKMNILIAEIQEKKELSSLAPALIEEQCIQFLHHHKNILHNLLEKKQIMRSASLEAVVKHVRRVLRISHGVFQKKQKEQHSRETLFSQMKNAQDKEGALRLLSTHASTKERSDHYESLYRDIFARTGMPKKILDLGCGINPFSYPFLIDALSTRLPLSYYASDISEKEIRLINTYFALIKKTHPSFEGKATVFDLKKWNFLAESPSADVCFLFKVFDSIETKGHLLAEKIITTIPARHIIASFSTHTISGKQMHHPARGWIERMLTRIDYPFTCIHLPNEVFYVITTKRAKKPALSKRTP